MTEDLQQLNRSLMERAIDKAANDPQFKQQLIYDPVAAIQDAGFPEVQQLQEMTQGQDVTGQSRCTNVGFTFICTITS